MKKLTVNYGQHLIPSTTVSREKRTSVTLTTYCGPYIKQDKIYIHVGETVTLHFMSKNERTFELIDFGPNYAVFKEY
jgi:hypothetical protein